MSHTFKYKTGFIHVNISHITGVETITAQIGFSFVDVKSVHAAKIWITKRMKG